jgi:hypothetical protein
MTIPSFEEIVALLARGFVNAASDRADVLVGLHERHTVAETPDHSVVMRRPARVFPLQIGRQPQTHVWRELKPAREHADNGEDLGINLQV